MQQAAQIRALAEAEAEKAARVGIAQAIAVEEQVRAYGGPQFQVTQQVMSRFAEAIERAGVDVVPAGLDGEKPRFLFRWQPSVLLSRSEREAHGERSPTRWTKRLLDGLSEALFQDEIEPDDGLQSSEANEVCRRFVWSKLMPTGHCLAARDVPAERALEVERMLKDEGVSFGTL